MLWSKWMLKLLSLTWLTCKRWRRQLCTWLMQSSWEGKSTRSISTTNWCLKVKHWLKARWTKNGDECLRSLGSRNELLKRSWKKLASGGNSTAACNSMAGLSSSLFRKLPAKWASLGSHSMTTCCRFVPPRALVLILESTSLTKLECSASSCDRRKRTSASVSLNKPRLTKDLKLRLDKAKAGWSNCPTNTSKAPSKLLGKSEISLSVTTER